MLTKMTNTERFFADTNVLVYLISDDASKARTAAEILKAAPFISVQVLNEFVSVARRKHKKSWDDIHDVLDFVKTECPLVALTVETHERAIGLVESSSVSSSGMTSRMTADRASRSSRRRSLRASVSVGMAVVISGRAVPVMARVALHPRVNTRGSPGRVTEDAPVLKPATFGVVVGFEGFHHHYHLLLAWAGQVPARYDGTEFDDVRCRSVVIEDLPRRLRDRLPDRVAVKL